MGNNNIYQYPMSTNIMDSLRYYCAARANKRLQRRVSFLELELQQARIDLDEIKSCRDCTFIGCRQCAKEKPCDAK
jgi:hypothetical protein